MPDKSSPTRQRFQLASLILDADSPEALFRQLENQLREAIWQGRLKSGERLPSSRSLATELGVARNTVVNAYEQLAIEGFIVTTQGSGTRVSHQFPPQPASAPDKPPTDTGPMMIAPAKRLERLSQLGLMTSLSRDGPAAPFRPHTTAIKEFPAAIWAQLTARALRYKAVELMEKCHPSGYAPLREAIAGYLGAARGMRVQPEQIMVTAGAQQGIELLARVLIDPGDLVAVEEPGYTPAIASFAMAGARCLSIPVNDDGFDVGQLIRRKEKVKLVYLTPAGQFPLGMPLAQSCRRELLQWMAHNRTLIVEDDYNGEYRYRGRPLPTLFAMAKTEQVIYVGSFSKLLFPALRLGFIVVPESLIRPLAAVRGLLDRHSPPIEQAVLADFINQGHFARHLRRMRVLYAERQHALVQAADTHLAEIMRVPALDGGLHLIGWLRQGVCQQDVLNAATEARVELTPTSLFFTMAQTRPGVILGYAPHTPEEIRRSVKALQNAYAALPKTHSSDLYS